MWTRCATGNPRGSPPVIQEDFRYATVGRRLPPQPGSMPCWQTANAACASYTLDCLAGKMHALLRVLTAVPALRAPLSLPDAERRDGAPGGQSWETSEQTRQWWGCVSGNLSLIFTPISQLPPSLRLPFASLNVRAARAYTNHTVAACLAPAPHRAGCLQAAIVWPTRTPVPCAGAPHRLGQRPPITPDGGRGRKRAVLCPRPWGPRGQGRTCLDQITSSRRRAAPPPSGPLPPI